MTEEDLKFAIDQMEVFGIEAPNQQRKCLSYLYRLARGVDQFVVMLHFCYTEWKADSKGEQNCYKEFLLSLINYDKPMIRRSPEKIARLEPKTHDLTEDNFPGLSANDPIESVIQANQREFADFTPKKYAIDLCNFPGLGSPS